MNGSLSFDASAAKIESASQQGRIKGGKTINKSSDLRKSLMGDVESGNGSHSSSMIGKSSMTGGKDDPYYVVKEDLLAKLDLVEDSLERYERIVKNTVR